MPLPSKRKAPWGCGKPSRHRGKGLQRTATRATEVFRVIRGMYRFDCGDDEFVAAPGAVITLPPFVPHSWRNISDEAGQMFAIVTPGGCERLFLDIAATGARTAQEVAVIERRLGIINEATRMPDV